MAGTGRGANAGSGLAACVWRRMPGAFLACLVLCLGSGLVLAFQYRPMGDVMAGVEEMTTLIPFGYFLRRLHFVSGQACAVLALCHVGRYFLSGSYARLRLGTWLRLTLGLAACLLLVLTGFMLKGDAEARHAATIMSGLAGAVPLAGTALASLATGTGQTFFMAPYVLHCMALPAALVMLLIRHVRDWIPDRVTLAAVSLALGAWSLTVPMALPVLPGDPSAPATGPWLFLGLQAMLMHLPPLWAGVVLPMSVLVLFCSLPALGPVPSRVAHILLLILGTAYVVLSLIFATCPELFALAGGWPCAWS